MTSIQDALALAIRLQSAGQFERAAAVHAAILAAVPDHVDALHLSALALRRLRGPSAGARRIEAALALQPDFAEALANLGNLRRDQGQTDAAILAFCRARRLKPSLVAAHGGLAAALFAAHRHAEAVAAWRRGMTAHPGHADLGNALGNALHEMGDERAGETAYRAALAADPAHPAAWSNRGTALRGLNRLDESLLSQRRARRISPFLPAAFDGEGLTLLRLDRPAEALVRHRRAIALQPDFTGAHANLGNAALALNDVGTAIAAYRRAIVLAPDLPDPHRNLGIALLLAGALEPGWPEYEWRLRCADSPTPPIPRPQWTGGPLQGQTILLHSEQGLGDALQFARYVPLVAARGARVVLCAPAALERLLAPLPGVERFVQAGTPLRLTGIDQHASLLSLPRAFATGLSNLPAPRSYLTAPAAALALWEERLNRVLGPRGGDWRVGVAWAGSPGHGNDRNRSLPLDCLLPLGQQPGVRLVSVQKGPPADQLAERARSDGPAAAIVNLAPDITDFADTAAIMTHLDLVICVDTSVAHLAGALGRPTWVLLPFAPDWRWMLHRTDNPWYPTLRLFRQTAPGAWGPVLAEASRCLGSFNGT